MEPVRVNYIPATTRATMARLGLSPTVEVAGDAYELPPHDMPGELQWRVDLLKWLVRKIFHYLASLPKDQWIQKLLVVERELMTKTGLHILEAQAVAEGALASIQDLSVSEVDDLARIAVFMDARSKSDGEALTKRYEKIVRKHARMADRVDANADVSKREVSTQP